MSSIITADSDIIELLVKFSSCWKQKMIPPKQNLSSVKSSVWKSHLKKMNLRQKLWS